MITHAEYHASRPLPALRIFAPFDAPEDFDPTLFAKKAGPGFGDENTVAETVAKRRRRLKNAKELAASQLRRIETQKANFKRARELRFSRVMSGKGPMPAKVIATALHTTRDNIGQSLLLLVNYGQVRRTGTGVATRYEWGGEMTCRREKELLEQIEQTGEMYKVSALQLIKAGKRIAELEALNGALCLDSAGFVQERDALAAQITSYSLERSIRQMTEKRNVELLSKCDAMSEQNQALRESLRSIAMDNRPYTMAQNALAAIALPDLSADILRARDARVLREMAERLEDYYATGDAAVDAVMMTRKAANAMEANHG